LADWWLIWRVPVTLLIVMAVWWFGFRPAANAGEWVEVDTQFSLCGERERGNGCVVDGDTLVIGFGEGRRRIRLIGFDTPEIDGACDAESALAQTARERLHQWLGEGAFEWSGAGDPPFDQYGRELREVRRIHPGKAPEYLADVMIEGGLAAENGWGAWPQDWCE
jgi:endonuclease YncB( thermonuclease family)